MRVTYTVACRIAPHLITHYTCSEWKIQSSSFPKTLFSKHPQSIRIWHLLMPSVYSDSIKWSVTSSISTRYENNQFYNTLCFVPYGERPRAAHNHNKRWHFVAYHTNAACLLALQRRKILNWMEGPCSMSKKFSEVLWRVRKEQLRNCVCNFRHIWVPLTTCKAQNGFP